MKKYSWQIFLGMGLILLSAVLGLIHYSLYKDAHNFFYYLLMDVSFVPIEVLLVTVIIDQLLRVREKNSLLKKLNMVIGTFFSEVGTDLIKSLITFDPAVERLRQEMIVSKNWSRKEFMRMRKDIQQYDYAIEVKLGDLAALKLFLVAKRDFLLTLLENPNLLEHESFTELLWAVFHLAEELGRRPNVVTLSQADALHLAGDIKRVYGLVAVEWLRYMEHLSQDYPYLFSLAMRTNPFDKESKVELG
jgi:hypothetical protein